MAKRGGNKKELPELSRLELAIMAVVWELGECSSAEVIAEAPSDGTVLPLADFGTVNFANATVDNAPIGAGPAGTALSELVMQSAAGADLATPSALTGGNAFSVTWDGSGSSGAAPGTGGPAPVPPRHRHHRGAGL